jgi:hypothetical protein
MAQETTVKQGFLDKLQQSVGIGAQIASTVQQGQQIQQQGRRLDLMQQEAQQRAEEFKLIAEQRQLEMQETQAKMAEMGQAGFTQAVIQAAQMPDAKHRKMYFKNRMPALQKYFEMSGVPFEPAQMEELFTEQVELAAPHIMEMQSTLSQMTRAMEGAIPNPESYNANRAVFERSLQQALAYAPALEKSAFTAQAERLQKIYDNQYSQGIKSREVGVSEKAQATTAWKTAEDVGAKARDQRLELLKFQNEVQKDVRKEAQAGGGKFWDELDSKMAKELAEGSFSGSVASIRIGADKITTQMNKLKTSVNENPEKYKSGFAAFLGRISSEGGVKGALADVTFSKKYPEIKQLMEESRQVIQESLKATLGAQFAKVEGEQLLQRAFDPALSPEQNISRLEFVRAKMEAIASEQENIMSWMSDKGTMRGYPGFKGGSTVQEFLAEKLRQETATMPGDKQQAASPMNEFLIDED